jgi:hypothetical protein
MKEKTLGESHHRRGPSHFQSRHPYRTRERSIVTCAKPTN